MWPRALWQFVHRDEADAELDDEIRFHLDRRTDELVTRGLSAEEARLQARREFGGVEQVKEECRDVRALRWLESLSSDLRYGWRSLVHTPLFTAVAALSLAIGIGANTALFSLAHAALLRQLPLPEPERLVELVASFPDGHLQTNLEAEVLEHLRRQPRPAADLVAYLPSTLLARPGEAAAEPVNVLFLSGNGFSALGVRPALGRVLREEDDRPGLPPVVVLSHSFWLERMGGREEAIGRTLRLSGFGPRSQYDGFAAVVVGVAPPGFFGVDRSATPALFLPHSAQPPVSNVHIVGRLAAGASIATAEAELAPLYAQSLASMQDRIRRWPARDQREFLGQRLRLFPAGSGSVGLRWELERPLKVLSGAVLLVIAIACTNVAALQLSRGERRVPEVAVRLSLGAARARVVRQLLTESTLLALLGAAGALLLAFVLHRLLVGLSPLDPTAVVGFELDWRVFGAAFLLSTLAGLVTGLLPALRLARVEPFPVLKGERGATQRWRSAPRLAILTAQVAATTVLLAGAFLLLRSLDRLERIETGFDRQRVLLLHLDPGASRFRHSAPSGWGSLVAERVAALPGVRAAALGARAVFPSHSWIVDVWVEGHAYEPGERQSVDFNAIGPAFFATTGIPVLAGREFEAGDRVGSPPVAIVNEAFARKYSHGRDPIGLRFRDGSTTYEVIGLVANAKAASLQESPSPGIYLPLGQRAEPATYPLALHVRTAGDPMAMAAAVRRAVASIDPDIAIRRLRTLDAAVSATLQRERMLAGLLSIFAGLTLLLTAVGLYGSMAYTAARRTAEVGLRMALGAGPGTIVGWMVKEAGLVIAAGCAAGLAIAVVALRALRSVVFELGTLDPASLAAAVLGVVVVGLAAAALPAWRAARLPPMTALRHE